MAIMEGAHPGVEKLVPNLPGLGQSKKIQPISQGLIDDDVTVVEKAPAKPAVKKPPVKPAAPVKKTEAAKDKPAATEKPVQKDMSMDMPGATASQAPEKPPAKSGATPEDMSMEFNMPGAEATPAVDKKEQPEEKKAPDEGDMSLDFDMPGAETKAEEKKADDSSSEIATEQELMMEFEMPGAEVTPAADKKEEPGQEQSIDLPGELDIPASEAGLEIEDPSAGQSAATAEEEQSIDLSDELEIPVDHSPVDTEAPPDLSMEFELPGADTPAEEEIPAVDEASSDSGLELDFDLPEDPAEKKSPEKITDTSVETASKQTGAVEKTELSSVIFRAYDIRGIVGKTLTVPIVHQIGQAIGSEAEARGQKTVVVGRDGRTSSPDLAEALTQGLRSTGRDVIDIGMIPTPVLYFATHHLETGSGVMVTGSHNGPAYNGLKVMLAGETLASDAIQGLYRRVREKDMVSGKGGFKSVKVIDDYIKRISEDVPVTLGGALKIVIDCGNGVAGLIAPRLFKTLGHEVIELYCEVDGKFPNHHPDPSQPENLQDLVARVKQEQADLGLAFDGDGDRLGVVDGEGNIIWPDRQMMVLARDVVSRNQGAPIIFDVKCSHHLKAIIEENGGKPLMWKTGHSLIKAKMKEVNAPLAGEMSGHIFFKERWYGFDDAMYAGARMVEILTSSNKKPSEVFSGLPGDVSTPEIRISLKEKYHEKFMKMLKKKIKFEDGELIDIDGIRVDFPYGWGLIRPSNTSPFLISRFEAEDEGKLKMIQKKFHDVIKSVAPDLKLPF